MECETDTDTEKPGSECEIVDTYGILERAAS